MIRTVAALLLAAAAIFPGAASPSDDDDRRERRGARGHDRDERQKPAVSAERLIEIVERMCAGCHGADGNGATPSSPEFPRIAGTQREYLAKQMHDFRKGRRKNPVMEQMAKLLSEGEIEGLATYFAAQRVKPGAPGPSKLLGLGRDIYLKGKPAAGTAPCSSCHLEDGTGNVRYPMVAGQQSEYTFLQLKAFKNGDRDNDKGLVMQDAAGKLTEQELQAVAEYIASLGSR